MRKLLTLVILLIAPAIHATDFAGHELLIPIAGRTPGAYGSQWRTDLYVTNADRRSAAPGQPVTIIYSQAGGGETALTRTIDSLATLILKDAILHSFGSEQSVGIIRIIAAPNAKITARARVYNIGSPQGEFGQTVPALPAAKLTRETYVPGLSGLGGNRTNVGIANPSGEEAIVFLSLFEESGNFRGGFSASVPPHGVLLLNDVFSHFQAGPLDGAMLRVGSSHGVYPYASIVRNDSGDADFVPGTGVVTENNNAIVEPNELVTPGRR